MCGICGCVAPDATPRWTPARPRDARHPRATAAPTATGEAVARRPAALPRLARPPPAEDHRPQRRGARSRWRATTARSSLTYNGEIYNFRELRRELRAAGAPVPLDRRHRGRPARVRALGRRLPSSGSTACSRSRVWDARARAAAARPRSHRQEAALLRRRGGRIAFGSEIKAVLACPWVERARSTSAPRRSSSTFGYVPDPATLYRGHRSRCRPASIVTFDARRAGRAARATGTRSPADAPARAGPRCAATIRAAAATTRSSAGWSPTCRSARCCRAASTRRSSSALMSQASTEPVHTFSDRLPGRAVVSTSARYARHGRRALRHAAHASSPSSSTRSALLDRLLWHHDQPFARLLGDPDVRRLASSRASTSRSRSTATAATRCSAATTASARRRSSRVCRRPSPARRAPRARAARATTATTRTRRRARALPRARRPAGRATATSRGSRSSTPTLLARAARPDVLAAAAGPCSSRWTRCYRRAAHLPGARPDPLRQLQDLPARRPRGEDGPDVDGATRSRRGRPFLDTALIERLAAVPAAPQGRHPPAEAAAAPRASGTLLPAGDLEPAQARLRRARWALVPRRARRRCSRTRCSRPTRASATCCSRDDARAPVSRAPRRRAPSTASACGRSSRSSAGSRSLERPLELPPPDRAAPGRRTRSALDLGRSPMRALVTGCAGFIGSHLTESLLADGTRGRSASTASTTTTDGARSSATSSTHGSGTRSSSSRSTSRAATSRSSSTTCDVVFHLAAEPGVRPSWGQRFERYVRNNVLATQHLLEAAQRLARAALRVRLVVVGLRAGGAPPDAARTRADAVLALRDDEAERRAPLPACTTPTSASTR